MGPKLMNCCKPEQVGTKEHGKMLKRIQVLEDGRVPAKKARDWKIERQKKRITWKEHTRNQEWNIIEASGYLLRTLFIGSIEPEHKTKDYNSGRHGRMPLLHTVLYHQNDFSKKWRTSFIREISRRLDLHQKLYSEVLGKCSSSNSKSSNKTFWECIRFAAGNSLRTIW